MKKTFLLLSAGLFMLFIASSAMAVGIGAYGEVQRGATFYGGNLGGDLHGSTDDTGGSGGLVIDTAVANDELFNYRLKIGGGRIAASKQKVLAFNLINTFGVSPRGLHGKYVRFWFGPRIGFHYQNLTFKGGSTSDLTSALLILMLNPLFFPFVAPSLMTAPGTEIKVDIFKGDIGLVFAGFNFNFGDSLTMTVELGFDYGFSVGKFNSGESEAKGYGEGIEGFATIGFLFRINDTYQKTTEHAATPVHVKDLL